MGPSTQDETCDQWQNNVDDTLSFTSESRMLEFDEAKCHRRKSADVGHSAADSLLDTSTASGISASQRTFTLPEIVELIVYQLDPRSMLDVNPINSTFRDTILKSKPVRRALFMIVEDSAQISDAQNSTVNAVSAKYNHSFFRIREAARGPQTPRNSFDWNTIHHEPKFDLMVPSREYYPQFTVSFASKLEAIAVLQRKPDSWANMHLISPPRRLLLCVFYPEIDTESLPYHSQQHTRAAWTLLEASYEALITSTTLGAMLRIAAKVVANAESAWSGTIVTSYFPKEHHWDNATANRYAKHLCEMQFASQTRLTDLPSPMIEIPSQGRTSRISPNEYEEQDEPLTIAESVHKWYALHGDPHPDSIPDLMTPVGSD